jgi:hypothetical protein
MECARLQIGYGVELYGVSYLFFRSMCSTPFVYTREGFVISADGRCTLMDGTVDSDTEIKIFDLSANRLIAFYAITGHIGSAFHDLTCGSQEVDW